jgi:hypothetical protein
VRELLESNPYRGQFDDDDGDEEHPKAKVAIYSISKKHFPLFSRSPSTISKVKYKPVIKRLMRT